MRYVKRNAAGYPGSRSSPSASWSLKAGVRTQVPFAKRSPVSQGQSSVPSWQVAGAVSSWRTIATRTVSPVTGNCLVNLSRTFVVSRSSMLIWSFLGCLQCKGAVTLSAPRQ